MAIPTDRASFKEFCLRALGKNVIEINVSEEQVDDRIDFALQTFYDLHFEGSDKTYYKFQVTANNLPDAIYNLTINDGGTGYTNGAALSFSNTGGSSNGTITTNSNGTITSLTFTNGSGWATAPVVSVAGGSGANITSELGGFVPLPENIIGVTGIFDLGFLGDDTDPLFSLSYQIIAHDLYYFNNLDLVPYYMYRQNIELIHEVLTGRQPLRYSRHQNKLYVDMDWVRTGVGQYLIVEAYQVIDPAVYNDVWKDRWLQRYATALIKEQWGNHLKLYGNLPMVGGIYFNGQQIYDEAIAEQQRLMEEITTTYSLPAGFMVG
jgi:hypothetical protein